MPIKDIPLFFTMDDKYWINKLKAIADYWFGKGSGEKLLEGNIKIIYGTTKRQRQVWEGNKRLFSIRAEDFYFILAWGALKIKDHLKKVYVKVDNLERSAIFARDIEKVDETILPGENVLILKDNKILGVGLAKVSSYEMKTMKFGEVIRIKEKF